ncbi:hypothetical protein HYC85_026736 [Camellia sinensis]|uniref:Uncharacterized protein n=1 Tax=Camellia sinensis TaxID=4442 RepID=A0A7J7G4W8_CAMSI|nr:hypothetical protein HYC85_026736 [Camellia sinensis]
MRSTSDAPIAPSYPFRSASTPPLDHSSPLSLTTTTSRLKSSVDASFTNPT